LLQVSEILFTFVNDKKNCVFHGVYPLRIENFSRTDHPDGNFKIHKAHFSLLFFIMKERIKQLMEAQHMNQQTFSKMTGISTASLSSIFNGRTNPTLMHVEAIRNKFPNINLNWLLYGEGGMFVPTSSPTPTSLFDESDPSQNPTQTTVPETSSKTDILAEGMLNFDDAPVHSAPQQVANTRKIQQPTFAIQSTPLRRITEIRVFYDDQTWESFVPKK
jgi:transcriptional regulator with XRE-family HTH domain